MEDLEELLKEKANEKLLDYKFRIEKIYPHLKKKYQWKKLHLTFTNNPLDDAGKAWVSSSTIELNLCYFPKYYDYMLKQILGHEICHILEPLIWKIELNDHGLQWMSLMIEMGLHPNEYHNMELP